MLDNVLQHYIDNAVDTDNLGEYNANFKRFQKHIKQGKEGFLKSAYSAYRERSLGLGAMGFHSYLQSRSLPFEGIYATGFNHKAFKYIKDKLPKHLKDLQTNVEKLLISVVVAVGMLISSLLLLMLVLVLFVVVLLLRLSHIGLMFIRTKLYQARSKLRTNT